MKTKVITKKIVDKARKEVDNLSNMSRAELLQDIREILMKCKTTESDDVLAQTTQEKLENPIYTKKFVFNISHDTEVKHPEILELLHNIECVSLSCDSEDFSTCLNSDIRINTKNKYNEWANAYAHSFSDYFLRLLLCLMKEATNDVDMRKELYERFLIFTEDFDSAAFIKDQDKFEQALDLLDEATT